MRPSRVTPLLQEEGRQENQSGLGSAAMSSLELHCSGWTLLLSAQRRAKPAHVLSLARSYTSWERASRTKTSNDFLPHEGSTFWLLMEWIPLDFETRVDPLPWEASP